MNKKIRREFNTSEDRNIFVDNILHSGYTIFQIGGDGTTEDRLFVVYGRPQDGVE